MKVLPRRHFWGKSGLPEEIESEFYLGEEMIPEKVGEQFRNAGGNCQKVGFESADGSLGNVALMNV